MNFQLMSIQEKESITFYLNIDGEVKHVALTNDCFNDVNKIYARMDSIIYALVHSFFPEQYPLEDVDILDTMHKLKYAGVKK